MRLRGGKRRSCYAIVQNSVQCSCASKVELSPLSAPKLTIIQNTCPTCPAAALYDSFEKSMVFLREAAALLARDGPKAKTPVSQTKK